MHIFLKYDYNLSQLIPIVLSDIEFQFERK